MNVNGPVIVIEDDLDDQDMLIDVFHKLGHTSQRSFVDWLRYLQVLGLAISF